MEYYRPLVFSVIEFLRDQTTSSRVTEEAAESIEVAIQCLETAYSLDTHDPDCITKYKFDVPLSEIYDSALMRPADTENSLLNAAEATDEEKMQAAEYKTKGNEYMKEERYTDALEAYTNAISLDKKNAVYYCNRAAAFSKLSKNSESIDDCHRALTIDPSYGKAYGRMGIAHTALNEHADAHECYRKACELEPDNETYRANLQLSQEKLKQEATQSGANFMPPGGFGGMDMSTLLNNPSIMNMASQLMANPQIQQMMSNLVAGSEDPSAPPPDMSTFLSVGQQMASQMQQNNPELVEHLRHQFQSANTSPPSNRPNANNSNADNAPDMDANPQ